MVYRHEKEESKMTDFAIKDRCDKCGSVDDLEGIIYPNILASNNLNIEHATLCPECHEGFERFLEEKRKEYEKENHN
jgi:hypothetical protein